jgi:ABC-type phosphate/phosphonate transport system substrate-binding protein
MIANARMYSVSPEAAARWRTLLAAVIEHAGLDIRVIEHAEPAPINELWQRPDNSAVFMCGLPFSRAEPQPHLIAAPVPSPVEYHGLPQYWSEMVVRKDSAYHTLEDTFGRRIALTNLESQSGCWAALYCLMSAAERFPGAVEKLRAAENSSATAGDFPLYREVIAPQVTPLGAMSAVLDGGAEVAPIDSYAYCLLQKYRPDLTSRLRVVARTAHTPIPPLVASVTASDTGFKDLQGAFLEAHQISRISPLMADLLLERFVRPDPGAYDALRANFETAHRYWRTHRFAATLHPAFAEALGSMAGSEPAACIDH